MSAQRRKKRTREQIIVLVVDGLSGLAESPVLMPTISAIFDFKVIDSRYRLRWSAMSAKQVAK